LAEIKIAQVVVLGGEHGSALQAAIHQGHGRIIELLIEKGANPNIQSIGLMFMHWKVPK
jgi:ankyrin repeat protein